MASLTKLENGSWRLQFQHKRSGAREAVYLGKVNQKTAQVWSRHIDDFESSQRNSVSPPAEAIAWAKKLPSDQRQKLEKYAFIKNKDILPETLGGLSKLLLQQDQSKKKEKTIEIQKNAIQQSLEFFGEKRRVDEITDDDVEQFRSWLKNDRGFAENTVVTTMKRLSALLLFAHKNGLIESNPCNGKIGSFVQSTRMQAVEPFQITRLMELLPDLEWQVIVGLAAYCGLRCPSEINLLQWSDVDWLKNKTMTVTSPKTERYEGKDRRITPIFDEIYPILRELWESRGRPANGFVITEHRTKLRREGHYQNYSTPLRKIAKRHGFSLWNRPFQNLRVTFISKKVAEGTPLPVICKWVGQSELVASKHYVSLVSEHKEKASTWNFDDWKTTQNTTQHGSAETGNNGQRQKTDLAFVRKARSFHTVPTHAHLAKTPAGGAESKAESRTRKAECAGIRTASRRGP